MKDQCLPYVKVVFICLLGFDRVIFTSREPIRGQNVLPVEKFRRYAPVI